MLASGMKETLSQLVPTGNGRPPARKQLFGLDAEALTALMVEAGEPAFRGRQLAEAIYCQRIAEIDEISTLPKALRQRLVDDGWQIARPAIAQRFQSIDGTERYLIQQADGLTTEAVWMPEGDGGESGDGSNAESADSLDDCSPERESIIDCHPERAPIIDCHPERAKRVEGPAVSKVYDEARRSTICVSSQVGCAVNCQFCLTARLGLQRNLTAGEIAGQVLAIFERHAVEVGRNRVNLVFMGMGEPFLNYDGFIGAVRLLVSEVGLSPRRMTVSTSGIVPGIERFAAEDTEFRPKLAISLNAPNDSIRDQIMPVNRKWPITVVMDAVRRVQLRPRERITFEYVLLGGVNDRPQDAAEVARLLRRSGLPAKVNLIAWNPGPGINYATPQPEAVEAFRRALADAGIPAYVRKPRGREIYAACGQLKRTVEG